MASKTKFFVAVAAAALTFSSVNIAAAGSNCDACGCNCQATRLVAKTVMVPTVVTERRFKSCVVKTMKEREETYTAFKRVPVTRKYTKKKCYLEDEVKTKMITETKCKHVKNPVISTVPVKVPVEEFHERLVQREVCTECGKVCIEEPCTCKVVRLKTDLETRQCEVNDVVFEKVKREIDYCVKTPKVREELCAEETTYELVPVEKTRKVQVCVPEVVKKAVDVQVTKMLPKTIYCCEKCAGHHH